MRPPRISIRGADGKAAPDDNLPVDPLKQRLVGISPDGHRVDNVHAGNAHHVNSKHPDLLIHLYDHEERHVIAAVIIPNTRERPDIVEFDGKLYHVVTTLMDPPRYAESMVAKATIPMEGT